MFDFSWSLAGPGFESEPQLNNQYLQTLVNKYLNQVEVLKKPNTYRKYEAVLNRFARYFEGRTFDRVSVEDLNSYIIHLKKNCGMTSNTVLHNVIIIAQFFKRHGRGGITRELQLPERITTLPREYREQDLLREGNSATIIAEFCPSLRRPDYAVRIAARRRNYAL